MSLHNPVRPSWTCSGCADPWPCHNRRLELLAQFDGALTVLALNMYVQFLVAADDMPDAPCGPIVNRFTGWLNTSRRPR
jgi:hypothetical protein